MRRSALPAFLIAVVTGCVSARRDPFAPATNLVRGAGDRISQSRAMVPAELEGKIRFRIDASLVHERGEHRFEVHLDAENRGDRELGLPLGDARLQDRDGTEHAPLSAGEMAVPPGERAHAVLVFPLPHARGDPFVLTWSFRWEDTVHRNATVLLQVARAAVPYPYDWYHPSPWWWHYGPYGCPPWGW